MVESAFVKDVTFNPSRNKGGAELGGWDTKKNSLCITLPLSQMGHCAGSLRLLEQITTNLVA